MRITTKQEGVLALVAAVLVLVASIQITPWTGVIFAVIGFLLFAWHELSKSNSIPSLSAANEARQQEKARNRQKLMEYLDSHERITNDDVQRVLNVSHATASNYLTELEEDNLIHESGEGRAIGYHKKSDSFGSK